MNRRSGFGNACGLANYGTGIRENERLARKNQIGGAQIRIRVCDARECAGISEFCLGYARERVAGTNDETLGGLRLLCLRREANRIADVNHVRIADFGIEFGEFVPSRTVAEMFFRELPERIPALNSNGVLRRRGLRGCV